MANVQAILATLGYIVSPDRTQVLLIHRNKRPDDLHVGKYNGLGGKLAPDEQVLDGMRREILEESGLIVDHLTLRGTISWPGFGKQGEDWFGSLSQRCSICLCGRVIATLSRWCLITIPGLFMDVCPFPRARW